MGPPKAVTCLKGREHAAEVIFAQTINQILKVLSAPSVCFPFSSSGSRCGRNIISLVWAPELV